MINSEVWRIRPEEPLILGGVRADSNFLHSLPYLPGRVLRGAWAHWLIRQGRAEQVAQRLAQTRIGNFFPAPEWRPVQVAAPLSLSAVTCKRVPGFRSEPLPERRGHGVLDMLLPQLAYTRLGGGARLGVPFLLECTEPGCHGRLEPARGFYCAYGGGPVPTYARVRPWPYAQTKVALARRRRAAAEGMLYTVTALSSRTSRVERATGTTRLSFLGRVQGSPEALAELREAVASEPLGALGSRGFGRVSVDLVEPLSGPSLEERIERFNATLARVWHDLGRLASGSATVPDVPSVTYFTIDLLAPGIFRRQGLPSLVPLVRVDGQVLEPIFCITRPDFVAGWSTAWGLPKPTDLAAQAGSVYVFRWDGPRSALIPALEELEAGGIGERCDESFGECRICDPFHEEVTER